MITNDCRAAALSTRPVLNSTDLYAKIALNIGKRSGLNYLSKTVWFDIEDNTLRLDITLDCGQCFRWEKTGSTWRGVIFGKSISAVQSGGNIHFEVICADADNKESIRAMITDYFDLKTDYETVLAKFKQMDILRRAVEFAPGIHILRQEPWEALCSFIISQNNNIPRIKGIISRLCESYGEELPDGSFGFPASRRLAPLSAEDLSPLRSGFRAKYILDAARKISDGEINLNALYSAPLDECVTRLQTIKGVGPKVAACALLYGLHRMECFPLDVWMKRAVRELLPDGLPDELLPYAGLAQQYLFHYTRMTYGKQRVD
ncbi:MAG: DNA-3-methyladenine glycosylase 2 family protein [Clostridia bacterium]|nr:DNA-3-methyladenine glycosylase 2 family protein [Clostridia bacterium]